MNELKVVLQNQYPDMFGKHTNNSGDVFSTMGTWDHPNLQLPGVHKKDETPYH